MFRLKAFLYVLLSKPHLSVCDGILLPAASVCVCVCLFMYTYLVSSTSSCELIVHENEGRDVLLNHIPPVAT